MSKLLKKITVSEELKSEIVKDMPPDLKDLEKAIYIYIKMCKILTYDDEYFVLDEKELIEENSIHQTPSNVSKITPQNNKIVCYEFCALYSKLIQELGAKVNIEDKNYGKYHMDVRFELGGFNVIADSTTSIINGDLINSKINEKIEGLSYDCDEANTQKIGNKMLKEKITKVYDIIKNQEKNKQDNANREEEPQTFDAILSEYKKEMPDIKVELKDKFDVFLDKIHQASLQNLDLLGYMLKLQERIFNKDGEEQNIDIVIIRKDCSHTGKRKASAIITINSGDVNKQLEKNIYFLYTPRQRNVCYNNG